MLSHQYDWITVNTRLRLICQNVSPVLPDVKRTFEFSARESNCRGTLVSWLSPGFQLLCSHRFSHQITMACAFVFFLLAPLSNIPFFSRAKPPPLSLVRQFDRS